MNHALKLANVFQLMRVQRPMEQPKVVAAVQAVVGETVLAMALIGLNVYTDVVHDGVVQSQKVVPTPVQAVLTETVDAICATVGNDVKVNSVTVENGVVSRLQVVAIVNTVLGKPGAAI